MRRCPRRFRRHAIRTTKRGARAGRLWELWRREKGDGVCIVHEGTRVCGCSLRFEGRGTAREEVAPARNIREASGGHTGRGLSGQSEL